MCVYANRRMANEQNEPAKPKPQNKNADADASARARHIKSSEYKLFIYKQIIYQIFILVIEQKLD